MDEELRFLDILSELIRHEVEFIVVGGVAAILEGAPISTFDLDIVYCRTDANNRRLVEVLSKLSAIYKDPAGRHIAPDQTKLATINIHLLRTDLGPLDVLSRIGEDLVYEDLLDHCFEYEIDELRLKVLDLETNIAAKELANREKDLAVLPILRRTLELKRSAQPDLGRT